MSCLQYNFNGDHEEQIIGIYTASYEDELDSEKYGNPKNMYT